MSSTTTLKKIINKKYVKHEIWHVTCDTWPLTHDTRHGTCYTQHTGVHPCSCKSQRLPAPDTHLTNTDGRALCHTCMTRWVGRGGVGIRCFSNIHLRLNRPSVYKKSKQYIFEKIMVMFTPNSDQLRGIWGPPRDISEMWQITV